MAFLVLLNFLVIVKVDSKTNRYKVSQSWKSTGFWVHFWFYIICSWFCSTVNTCPDLWYNQSNFRFLTTVLYNKIKFMYLTVAYTQGPRALFFIKMQQKNVAFWLQQNLSVAHTLVISSKILQQLIEIKDDLEKEASSLHCLALTRWRRRDCKKQSSTAE